MSVQISGRAPREGGATGAGFRPGVSGNPGGRPRGLARRVRELVGERGEVISEFMLEVMTDPSQRTADRITAAKWLAERGFGRAPESDERPDDWRDEIDFDRLTVEELTTLREILIKAAPRGNHVAGAAIIDGTKSSN